MPVEVAGGVIRLGSKLVNWYLVEDGGRLTIVDAGLPGYWPQLPAVLGALGRRLADVEAVLLTHAHADHIGLAGRIEREAGARVLVHGADRELLLTGKQPPRERSVVPELRHPAAWRLFLHVSHAGGRVLLPERVETFADGDVLDVPGRPRVLHAPGHSEGCCAFHFEGHGVLVAGDVLGSRDVLTGKRGPRVPPAALNVSSERAVASLARLEGVEAPVVLFGHGDPWTDGLPAALAAARAAFTGA
jgi:glyoxylase-like metal-dependent hydrolase (beta-lactamase superfamily II)